MPPKSEPLSIGDLAEASGIGVGTIRAWETRYGRPVAERLPSGHRRYRAKDVAWLRRIAEALALGHRPSEVVHLSPAVLAALIEKESPADPGGTPEAWLARAKGYEGGRLSKSLRSSWEHLGTAPFLDDRLGPFLEAVGHAWAAGTISIRHEHWAAQVVEDFLRSRRRAVGARGAASGRPGILATLPGESHGLGLQMAALVAAGRRVKTRILGANSPVEEIAAAGEESGARFIGVSVSLATGGIATDRVLADLRAQVPESIAIIVGGRGARGPRRGPKGVETVASMREFDAWVAKLAR